MGEGKYKKKNILLLEPDAFRNRSHEDMDFIFEWRKKFSFYYIDSMQQVVNDVIDIFTSEDMENWNKRSVLRRQSRDTNRNIERSIYCQYGYYSLTFRALALRQRETAVSFWTHSLRRSMEWDNK